MLSNLKNQFIIRWNLMRFIRLALALILIIETVHSSEFLFAILGGLLLFQAAFNYGCCGAGGCDINHNSRKSKSGTTGDVTTFNEAK